MWRWTWSACSELHVTIVSSFTHLVPHPDSTIQYQYVDGYIYQESCNSPAPLLAPHPKILHSQTLPAAEPECGPDLPRAGAAAAHRYLSTQPLSYHLPPLAMTTESHSPDTRVSLSCSCRMSASARRIALCALGYVSRGIYASPAGHLALLVLLSPLHSQHSPACS
jgi:hypothetical protein